MKKANKFKKEKKAQAASFREHIPRSLAKAITYRLVSIVADFVVIFSLTRRYDITLSIVLITNLTSMLIYFVHERVWNTVHWGKE